ncbi:gamma-type small acid-soluble spore protein [Metabacillus arenae]|uniref:Small, acid-soluble spore protein gamma-type n=1 Tax=Metabacillus arenae TaxID=2771434 RepID=A0A926NEB2_9BACI|nr:gamma-type small acid-soluble spore protein [Metabacillus arenae]MBD1379661.1 gamma-type small acid-soluble spore protein [Metabacillus arenae]
MANNQQQPQASKTNAQQVKKQNQAAAQGQYGAEFASETDAQQVRQQNAQAQQKKAQQQQNNQ